MPWNHMQIELSPRDSLILPLIGPGDLTHDQAHAEVQTILDRLPGLAELAAVWRRGARGDAVYAGPFTWCLYEHQAGDPYPGARAWLEEYASTIRATGIDVQVAQPRASGGTSPRATTA